MALPAELRHLLWVQLPLTIFETAPQTLLRYYLAQRLPRNLALQAQFHNPALTTFQNLLKLAAWGGLAGISNQIYLPYGLSLANAVATPSAFLDALLRGQKNEATMALLLRELQHQPATTETLLAYYLTTAPATNDELLFQDVINGRTKLTKRAAQLIVAASQQVANFPHGTLLLALAHGALAPSASSLTSLHTIVSYLAHGHIVNLQELPNAQSFVYAATLLDRPDLLLNVDPALYNEERILAWIAAKTLSHFSQAQARLFPAISNIDDDMSVDRGRVKAMLTLVPKIYAASAAREKYLAYLQFFLEPTGPAPADMEPALLLRFGRCDLLPLDYFADWGGARDLINFKEPTRFVETFAARQFAQVGVLLERESLLTSAVYYQQLAETSAAIAQNLPNQLVHPAETSGTLENLLDQITFLPDGTYYPVNNSLALQELYTAKKLFLDKQHNDYLTWVYAAERKHVQFVEHVSPYDLMTWQELGARVDARPQPDPRITQAQQLLATL